MLDIINLHDLEREAERPIPGPQLGYIGSGASDEWTLRENARTFDDVEIAPEYLVGIDQPHISTTLLGSDVALPIFVLPMAAQILIVLIFGLHMRLAQNLAAIRWRRSRTS